MRVMSYHLSMLVIDNDTSSYSTESYFQSGIAGLQQGRFASTVPSFESEFRDNDQPQTTGGDTSDSSGVAGDQEKLASTVFNHPAFKEPSKE
jgi:hypothetical protein